MPEPQWMCDSCTKCIEPARKSKFQTFPSLINHKHCDSQWDVALDWLFENWTNTNQYRISQDKSKTLSTHIEQLLHYMELNSTHCNGFNLFERFWQVVKRSKRRYKKNTHLTRWNIWTILNRKEREWGSSSRDATLVLCTTIMTRLRH